MDPLARLLNRPTWMLCLELWDPLSRPLCVLYLWAQTTPTHPRTTHPPGCSTLPCRILNSLEGLLIRSITSPRPPSRLPRFLLFENHSTSLYISFSPYFLSSPWCRHNYPSLSALGVLLFCLFVFFFIFDSLPQDSLHVPSISRLRHTTNQSILSITDLTLRSLRSLARSPSPHLPLSYFNSSVPHLSRRCLRTPRIGFFRYTSRPHGFLHPAPAGSHWQPPAPAEST